MNSIKLTEEHKSKLLEMCKVLFPEFGEVQLLKSYCATEYDATGSPYLRWYIPYKHEEKNTTKLVEIHWFEFCMTHLLYNLYNKLGASDLIKNDKQLHKLRKKLFKVKTLNLFVVTVHPIDYLYEEFKKLKP